MLKKLLSLILCTGMAPILAEDLAPAVASGELWQMDIRALAEVIASARFSPVDDNTLRFPRQATLSVGTLNVGEVVIRFSENSKEVELLQISIYNRGDDGELDKKDFETLVDSTAARLDELTGTGGKQRKMLRRDTGIDLRARIWETDKAAWLMEAADNGNRRNFSGEFIRVTVGADAEALERGGAHDAAHRSALRGRTKKEDNGDVWIEGIPMVDQGQKGYCVPATVSRVFAYYGMDGVDQHALAALCNSSGDGGTSVMKMESALRDISNKFHIKVIELDKGGYAEFISSYNAAAKKLKKPALTPRKMLIFDPAVLTEARAAKPAQTRKWLKAIRKNIDAGLPVIWSVQLAFPEEGLPQAGGGHMRLIIGYNEEKGTIIYSDSWGARHARKEMPLEQACAMTVCRYVLRPTR